MNRIQNKKPYLNDRIDKALSFKIIDERLKTYISIDTQREEFWKELNGKRNL